MFYFFPQYVVKTCSSKCSLETRIGRMEATRYFVRYLVRHFLRNFQNDLLLTYIQLNLIEHRVVFSLLLDNHLNFKLPLHVVS